MLVTVLAVNNYPTEDRFERLRKCIRRNGAKVEAATWKGSSSMKFNSFDGVVLSGSPDMLSEVKVQSKYGAEVDAIIHSEIPLLGVCFGHQMIAHAFGSAVVKDAQHVLGFVQTRALVRDPIFEGLPKRMMLMESRHEIVGSLPKEFTLVAASETSPIAAIKHKSRPIYGVQSHPERFSGEHPEGDRIVGNFVGLLG